MKYFWPFAALSIFSSLVLHTASADPCVPLPAPTGTTISVSPSNSAQLPDIVAGLRDGETLLFAPGTYRIARTLNVRTPRVTLRSRDGRASDVVLDAEYGSARELLNITASSVTVANLTLQRALDHAIHVQPGASRVTGVKIHGVAVIDAAQQAIKVNSNNGFDVDQGVIECSSMELTDLGRAQVRDNCYTGGIDVHSSDSWIIRNNTIAGFWCPQGLSEHGIHFWSGSRNTLVTGNYLINNVRGIGFGLGLQRAGRNYGDNPCGGLRDIGHYGGTIVNNIIFANDSRLAASEFGIDVGIGLEDTCGVKVHHNTIGFAFTPFSALEWRFVRANSIAGGPPSFINNLVTHRLRARDGATAIEQNNATVTADIFKDFATGDLHLKSTASIAIDKGTNVSVGTDFDNDQRDSNPDIGADELRNSSVSPTPTAIPANTPTAVPTATPTPLHTSTPSVTAAPTRTPDPQQPRIRTRGWAISEDVEFRKRLRTNNTTSEFAPILFTLLEVSPSRPSWLRFARGSGTFYGIAANPGTFIAKVKVSNKYGVSPVQTVKITVFSDEELQQNRKKRRPSRNSR